MLKACCLSKSIKRAGGGGGAARVEVATASHLMGCHLKGSWETGGAHSSVSPYFLGGNHKGCNGPVKQAR
jgi:hypothetical protein